MSGTPFSSDAYALKQDRAGRSVCLEPLTGRYARELGLTFASIDPWKKLDWPADRLETFLCGKTPGAPRYLIRSGGELAGAVAITAPWLHGAYMNFLGIVPGLQNAGIGKLVMDWFETESLGTYRNLWICVSGAIHRPGETRGSG